MTRDLGQLLGLLRYPTWSRVSFSHARYLNGEGIVGGVGGAPIWTVDVGNVRLRLSEGEVGELKRFCREQEIMFVDEAGRMVA